MATAITPAAGLPPTSLPTQWSLADLQQHLGGVPLERIRLYPPPGMATIEDALAVGDREDRLWELVDGVLVEKVMGTYESILAGHLIYLLHRFLEEHPWGTVLGPDGPVRLGTGRMRLPDVSLIRWERFPGRKLPKERVYSVAPDLAVEILSEGNTEGETARKLTEYFTAGVRLVWYIDAARRTATVYRSLDESQTVGVRDLLDGEDVLPGFQLRLAELFERAESGEQQGQGREYEEGRQKD